MASKELWRKRGTVYTRGNLAYGYAKFTVHGHAEFDLYSYHKAKGLKNGQHVSVIIVVHDEQETG